jgi:hypothetical protein
MDELKSWEPRNELRSIFFHVLSYIHNALEKQLSVGGMHMRQLQFSGDTSSRLLLPCSTTTTTTIWRPNGLPATMMIS